jgi:anti-sigma factor RsiW
VELGAREVEAMNCARTHQVIDAYLDGELDATTRIEVSEHLAQCPACAQAHAERSALAQRIALEVPRHTAPPGLKKRVQRIAAEADRARAALSVARGPTWLQAAAFALLAAALSLIIGYRLAQPPGENALGEAVVALHVASLREGHRLVDMTSNDRHVVKPWLQGKIDFAPQVLDLSGEGFALIGARLEPVEGRQAVAVVYRVRKHYVSLFVWRAASAEQQEPAVSQARGFSLAAWSQAGLRYTAISDVDSKELARFARLVFGEPAGRSGG